jgi:hypothetical protein
MATTKSAQWSLAQHFQVRASTVLIGYVLVFLGIGPASEWFSSGVQRSIRWCLETLGPGVLWIWLPTAILSLAFMIASLMNRNPQAQFFLELVMAVSFAVLMPVY